MCNTEWDDEAQAMVATNDCGRCDCSTSSAGHQWDGDHNRCTQCSLGW